MFEFITISNGVAVVQHAPSGYVYRFRPVHPGSWHALTLDRIDAGHHGGEPDDHSGAALRFASDAMASLCEPMPMGAPPEEPDAGWRPASRRRVR